jgi:murein DD-endopeptidase MepM/ murein hydrolase activator NlpD
MKIIKLRLKDPVDVEKSYEGGRWGDPRPYGLHAGIDYKAMWRSHVKASEDGIVVKSEDKKGSVERGSYGETIVIDHTPKAGDKQRHIYTLYAHLHKRLVSVGQKVYKGKTTIGESGNTGTKEYYRGLAKGIPVVKQKGHHLHFEVIDTEKLGRALDWSQGRWPSGYRQKPGDYLGINKTIEYPLTDEEMSKIQDSLDIDPVIDFKRRIYRFDAYLGGKKVGYFDKHKKEIKLSLTPEELEEILRNPTPPPRKEPKKLVYEIKI